jgi:hypothetical protein
VRCTQKPGQLTLAPGAHSLYHSPVLPAFSPRLKPKNSYPAVPRQHARPAFSAAHGKTGSQRRRSHNQQSQHGTRTAVVVRSTPSSQGSTRHPQQSAQHAQQCSAHPSSKRSMLHTPQQSVQHAARLAVSAARSTRPSSQRSTWHTPQSAQLAAHPAVSAARGNSSRHSTCPAVSAARGNSSSSTARSTPQQPVHAAHPGGTARGAPSSQCSMRHTPQQPAQHVAHAARQNAEQSVLPKGHPAVGAARATPSSQQRSQRRLQYCESSLRASRHSL